MVDGTTLWEKEMTDDMQRVEQFGRIVSTFPHLPPNLFESMKKVAKLYPNKTALVNDEGNSCSYRCFLERCEEFAAYLYRQKGIQSGSHVGIMMHNTVEYCVAFFALSRLGAVMVSLPSKFKQVEVSALAKQADLEYLICEQEYADWLDGICSQENVITTVKGSSEYGYEWLLKEWNTKDVDMREMAKLPSGREDAPSIMMFTSGTTSRSKAVLLKNRNIMHAIEAYRRILHITQEDSSVIATPIYHITGLVALLGLFLSVGGTLYLHKLFNAERLIQDAGTYGITFLHASPTVFHLFLQAGEDTPEIPSLRALACGSSNMPKEKIMKLHQWLPKAKFHTIYGLTETSSPGTIFPGGAADSPYIGSSGWPIPGMQIKIVNEDDKEVSSGEVGEIVVRGGNVLECYYGQTTEPLCDGWLYTGDLGYFNENHYLYVVDRKKNMINRGGEKIWCYDVENEMETIPEVRNAAVVGIPDKVYGESAAAVVELKSGSHLTAEEIQTYLKERIAKYKIPVKIKIVESIPQTPGGKPDKAAMKKMMAEA